MNFFLQIWHLQSTNGEPITLVFESFDIERHASRTCFDQVEINGGSFIQKYCGNILPAPTISTNTSITVKFSSDHLGTRSGFLALVCCSVNVTTDTAGEHTHKYTTHSYIFSHYFPVQCAPANNDWSCCTYYSKCGLGEGDCDHNSDCTGDLVCGHNNCPAGHPGLDCCTTAGKNKFNEQ